MKFKKIIVSFLSIILLLTSAFGCSGQSKESSNSKVPMGRYVEKPVDMPEKVQSGEESVMRVLRNPDGLIEIYCCPEESADGNYIQYTLSKNNIWDKVVPEWLNIKGSFLNSITYAPDGTKYAILISHNTDRTENIKFYKSTDNHTAKEIILEDYKDKVGSDKEPSVQMSVLKDNSILLSFYSGNSDVTSGRYSVYKDGKEAFSFKMGSDKYALSGNKLLSINENCDQATVIDVTTGKPLLSVPTTEYNYRNQFTADKDGNWYFFNLSGVQRLSNGGNTWEMILNGNQTSMSKASLRVDTAFFGIGDDFYVLYSTEMGERLLKHYIFDKSIPTTPSIQLTVAGLNWNDTIREALCDFNQAHPEAQIEYKQLESKDSAATNDDIIKTLNTELIAGKGPDVLILDGLPVDSYIEKKVLADVSQTISPMIENGELLSNIMKDIKNKDGKIYTVPARFETNLAFGDKDAVNAAKSIDTLASFAKTAKLPLFGPETLSYTDLSTMLYEMYSSSIIGDNGFDRNSLINFLQQLKLLSDQTRAVAKDTEYSILQDYESKTFCQLIEEKKALLGLHKVSITSDAYNPFLLADQTGAACSILNNTYSFYELMGVSNSSKYKDLACEFLKTVLNYNIQKILVYDGFPVNTKALETFTMSNRYTRGWRGDAKSTRLSKEKVQAINSQFKTVSTHTTIDYKIKNIVIPELVSYLSGKTSLEDTTDKILNETTSYLSLHDKE